MNSEGYEGIKIMPEDQMSSEVLKRNSSFSVQKWGEVFEFH